MKNPIQLPLTSRNVAYKHSRFRKFQDGKCAGLCAALILGSTSFASAAPFVPLAERTPPTLRVPHVETPPRLGGDEAIWAKGALIPQLGLAQGEASAGLKPVPTQVRLLWSKTGLYVSFRCQDNAVFTPEKGRDTPIWKGDVVEVFLDVKGDARQWIELEVSPNGDLFDQMSTLTAPPQSNENRILKDEVLNRDWWTNLSWNLEGWQVKARKNLAVRATPTSDWRVDMRIPPEAMGFVQLMPPVTAAP